MTNNWQAVSTRNTKEFFTDQTFTFEIFENIESKNPFSTTTTTKKIKGQNVDQISENLT